MNLLERTLVLIASLALSLLLIGLLSGFFAARDRSAVSSTAAAPGQPFTQLGSVLPDARPRPRLLRDLAAGDVAIAYGTRSPPPGLLQLAGSLAGRPTPALVQAGQAVLLRRVPGVVGLVGLAWRRVIRVGSVHDPGLSRFARYWLGRGTSG